MISYISIPIVENEQIRYKRIPVPESTNEFTKVITMTETDINFLMNQLENCAIATASS